MFLHPAIGLLLLVGCCLLAGVLAWLPFWMKRAPEAIPPELEALKEENERLRGQVEELSSVARQLEVANGTLNEHQHSNDDLIAHVAHELRAPLTLLLAPLESLIQGKHGALRRQQKQSVEIMYNNALRILQIIIGLLDHAASSSKSIEVRREPTDINALTSAILTDFMPYFEQRQIDCRFEPADSEPIASIDRYLYERILFNLLSNASKFTHEKGSVIVSLRYDSGRLALAVRDTGIGIAKDQLGSLFKKFHQAKGCASRRFEGTGLGLALVKEFAELLGGSVIVQSALGYGSTFTVDVAAEPAQFDAPEEMPPIAQTFKKPVAGAEIVPHVVPRSDEESTIKARILVADDNLEVAQYIAGLLEPLADVHLASNGRIALDMLYEWNPHIVVADVRMPEVDGIQLCRMVKIREETAHINVVLLSALTNRETMLRAWESGADDYLFKPFHESELITRLRTLIARMRERAQAEEKIQSLNKALEQRIGELDTANEELRWLAKELQSARDCAVAAVQTKSQFLANMSHEIRTPLNGLIATTELLLQSRLSDEQREFAMISRESALVLLETVNDLLDFSRMETGKLSLEMVDFNVVSLVEGATELVSARAREKCLSLMSYVSKEVPRSLYGDPARIRQVLINLLSNAVKFTEHGEVVCRVTLESATQARATVRFTVYDTGIGMPKSALRGLFEPFAQAESGTTRRNSGAGLGLSIARRLVELMGGTIGVESTQGQGSTFWFTVPLENRVRDEDEPDMPLPEKLKNLRILMVDGLQETQKVMQEYAQSWNMTFTAAANASEALALMGRCAASRKPFDLVMVEYDVSDMHPFTFARYVRNSPELCDTRLVMLTSSEEEGRGARALRCGYSGYLLKPIKQSILFDCMANVMSGLPPGELPALNDAVAPSIPDSKDNGLPIVLVVEDNAINQRVARLQLEELGFRVHIVRNGAEALDATARLKYDIILMDCAMPLVDGYQATSQIRKQEALAGRRTPIIALTAHSLPGDREKCLASGMDDYISKPVSTEQLQDVIARWLKSTEPSSRIEWSEPAQNHD